ncbi:MAG TPA: polysaccharide biosynthesis protein [Microscillaceae bacterium]|nr:polysaccharide biosynthesis protein [Microscillaceae bacterium]
MGVFKKLAGDTAMYGMSSIIGRTLNYFLVPLHTAVFLPADFGVLSELYVYMAFLNILFTYGMETTFFRYASRSEPEKSLQVYRVILSFVLLTTIVFAGGLLWASPSLATLLGYPDKAHFLVWLVLILAVDTLAAIPFAWLRQANQAKKFAFIKIANVVVTVLLNLFFLYFCKNIAEGYFLPDWKPWVLRFYHPEWGIGYVFLANLLANVLVLFFLYRELALFRFVWNWSFFRPMLQYGYPLLFMGLAGTVNSMIDRILLKYWLPADFYPGLSSIAVVGIYAACYKLSIFMSLTIQAFRYAAEPFFFGKAADKNAPELFAQVMKYFIIFCVVIWVVISLNLDILQVIFLRREAYRQAIGLVPVLLFGQLLLGIYYNLTVWFKLKDQTHWGTKISFVGAFSTLLLNLMLIPLGGYWGAAWATVLSYALMGLITYRLGQRHFPIPYAWTTISLHITAGAIIILLAFLLPMQLSWQSFAWHLFLLGLYIAGVAWSERKLLQNLSSRFAKAPQTHAD